MQNNLSKKILRTLLHKFTGALLLQHQRQECTIGKNSVTIALQLNIFSDIREILQFYIESRSYCVYLLTVLSISTMFSPRRQIHELVVDDCESKYRMADAAKSWSYKLHLSHVTRKSVFGVCHKVRLKPVYSASETS